MHKNYLKIYRVYSIIINKCAWDLGGRKIIMPGEKNALYIHVKM